MNEELDNALATLHGNGAISEGERLNVLLEWRAMLILREEGRTLTGPVLAQHKSWLKRLDSEIEVVRLNMKGVSDE